MLDTSTLSPKETKACTPSPTSRARSSSAKPMPPDWEATARPPTSGTSWRRVALRPAPLASTPCELGPTRRRLCARARVSSSWRRSSLPLPEKPDEMTTAAPAPLAAASRSTSATPSAGTATTTRSTGPSRSARLRTVGSPSMTSASGCTTCTAPAYAELRIASSTPCPKPPADRRTPTTATLTGCSSGRSDRAAARHSRWSAASTASREASVRSSTSTSPATVRRVAPNPAARKTRSIP